MENQNPRVPILWEHSLTNLLGHDHTSDPGIALRQWVHFQGVHNILDLLSWDQEELKAVPAQQIYSLDDHSQGLEGLHRFKSLAKKDKVLARAIKQSKIRQVRRSQTYMFGYLIPRNYMEAMQFDSENKNSKWYDAIKLEMESMLEYKVFKKWDKAILDKHKKVTNPPKGYHRIKVHLVFAVKFDGRHKARLVAENIYSGVVSLRNLRLVIFLGKVNHLELWGADIGNAYLEAFTEEKLYIVAGPEFQELEGYILIFLKALA